MGQCRGGERRTLGTARKVKQESLSVQWEELTLSDFPEAVKQARGLCVLPVGVIEPHGPHLPLCTDMTAARVASIRAAQKEYAVVFPPTTSRRSTTPSTIRGP